MNKNDFPGQTKQSLKEFYESKNRLMNRIVSIYPGGFEDQEDFNERVELKQEDDGEETLIIDDKEIVTFSEPRVETKTVGDKSKSVIVCDVEYHEDVVKWTQE